MQFSINGQTIQTMSNSWRILIPGGRRETIGRYAVARPSTTSFQKPGTPRQAWA